MKIKQNFRKLIINTTDKLIVDKKKLAVSYGSLFLAFLVLTVSTVSWFTVKDTASVNSDDFTMTSVSGLRVNDGEQDLSNHIIVKDFTLQEASSVDGRNMFFPTAASSASPSVQDLTFREGNAGDVNNTYVYKNFTLNADSNATYVYIKSYNIVVTGTDDTVLEKFNGTTEIKYDATGKPVSQVKHEECPLRLSFITDSSVTPTYIDPTALVDNHVKNYDAVDYIDATGKAATKTTMATTFSDYYYYSGQPIFSLNKTEPIDVTLALWLEGTGNNCDRYQGAKVSVNIELESNWTDMEPITFKDDTIGDDGDGSLSTQWISNNNNCIVTMAYKETDGIYKTIVMKPTQVSGKTTEWTAAIPKKVVTDIVFYRYSLDDNTIYNAWRTEIGVNDELSTEAKNWKYKELQESRELTTGNRSLVYTAKRGNGYGEVPDGKDYTTMQRLAPCIGYWSYDTLSGGESGGGSGGESGGGSGGTETPTTVKLGVNLAIPDNSWMRNDLSSGGNYDMYIELGDSTHTRIKMTYNNGVCNVENQIVPYSSVIRCFVLHNRTDNSEKLPILISSAYIIASDRFLSYTLASDTSANLTNGG